MWAKPAILKTINVAPLFLAHVGEKAALVAVQRVVPTDRCV
jgi:hypothetical protein